jgi:hypothetical protein
VASQFSFPGLPQLPFSLPAGFQFPTQPAAAVSPVQAAPPAQYGAQSQSPYAQQQQQQQQQQRYGGAQPGQQQQYGAGGHHQQQYGVAPAQPQAQQHYNGGGGGGGVPAQQGGQSAQPGANGAYVNPAFLASLLSQLQGQIPTQQQQQYPQQ